MDESPAAPVSVTSSAVAGTSRRRLTTSARGLWAVRAARIWRRVDGGDCVRCDRSGDARCFARARRLPQRSVRRLISRIIYRARAITFTSHAAATNRCLIRARRVCFKPGASDVTELVRGRSAPVQRLRIATDATGQFSLGTAVRHTPAMAPADTSAGDLALALRTSLPQLGSVVVERHDDSSSGMSEWRVCDTRANPATPRSTPLAQQQREAQPRLP